MTEMPSDNRATLRSSSVMAVGTITSRVTGLLKNTALLAAVGSGVFADTYSVANTLPTIVYILLVGGAINAVFIPQLVRHMEADDDEGLAYAQRLFSAVVLALAVITVGAVIAAPWLVQLYSTGWNASDVEVATAFARLLLPQIFFYGVFALVSQILNTRGRFGAPMFAPVTQQHRDHRQCARLPRCCRHRHHHQDRDRTARSCCSGSGPRSVRSCRRSCSGRRCARCGVRLRLRTDLTRSGARCGVVAWPGGRSCWFSSTRSARWSSSGWRPGSTRPRTSRCGRHRLLRWRSPSSCSRSR